MQLLADAPAAVREIPVLLNPGAGNGEAAETLQDAFREAGIAIRLRVRRPGEDIAELARLALRERPALLAAAGGDGTLSSVASVLCGSDTALGVLPMGTLNHFAKDLGVPLELEEAARVIARGRRRLVDVGEVNGKSFLNNASLGLYPDMVRERTRQQRRLGRSKLSAMLWATLATLNRLPLLTLRLELDGQTQDCRAPFVFVGNNDYTMEGFDIGTRERLDAGHLCVYTTRECGRSGLVRLALHALFGRLKQAQDFSVTPTRHLRVETPRRGLRVATDGEVGLMETPLEFRIRPRALQVIVP